MFLQSEFLIWSLSYNTHIFVASALLRQISHEFSDYHPWVNMCLAIILDRTGVFNSRKVWNIVNAIPLNYKLPFIHRCLYMIGIQINEQTQFEKFHVINCVLCTNVLTDHYALQINFQQVKIIRYLPCCYAVVHDYCFKYWIQDNFLVCPRCGSHWTRQGHLNSSHNSPIAALNRGIFRANVGMRYGSALERGTIFN